MAGYQECGGQTVAQRYLNRPASSADHRGGHVDDLQAVGGSGARSEIHHVIEQANCAAATVGRLRQHYQFVVLQRLQLAARHDLNNIGTGHIHRGIEWNRLSSSGIVVQYQRQIAGQEDTGIFTNRNIDWSIEGKLKRSIPCNTHFGLGGIGRDQVQQIGIQQQ